MTNEIFDVQAALLYEAVPELDTAQFMMWFSDWARDHGVPGPFMMLPGATIAGRLCFAGSGVHVTITGQDEPLEKDAFQLALRAPILKQKKFDFEGAIDSHTAAIVITVGDGETPMPPQARQLMAENGIVDAADPLLKLTILHLALQGINTMTRAKLIDFCPSQSLLTVPEVVATSHLSLPVPLLFHPFPVRNAPAEDGSPRKGLAAIHAPRLIGTELELEAIPADMPLQTRLGLLSSLISQKLDGAIDLAHGETVLLEATPASSAVDTAARLWIRHEEGSTDSGPVRVIASFDTEVAPPEISVPADGHQSFQDRIARLKQRGPGSEPHLGIGSSPEPNVYAESEEDLRARVQDTIGGAGPVGHETGGTRGFGLSKVLAIAAAAGCYLIFTFMSDANGNGGEPVSLVAQLLSAPEPVTTEPINTGETTSRLRSLTEEAFR